MGVLLGRWFGPVTVLGLMGLLVGCGHLTKHRDDGEQEGCPPEKECHVHARSCDKPTLMALGHDLDHLERHIDWHGSAVAKVPDVWGQARLTKHREEFEALMDPTNAENHLQFEVGLQGSLARSDQAFFAQATALSIAARPKPTAFGGNPAAAVGLVPTSQTVQVVATDNDSKNTSTTDTTFGQPTPPPPAATPPPPIATIQPADPKTLLDTVDKAVTRELVAKRTAIAPPLAGAGIGLEPTLMIAQKKRYLDLLAQIRRENEGDDTADSPGYEPRLIRIPVSVLPGKKTDEGHGAEVTMTLTPVLGDDLLPMTFRNLVVNDLLHQLGFPLTQFLDNQDRAGEFFTSEAREVIIGLPILNGFNSVVRDYERAGKNELIPVYAYLDGLTDEDENRLKALAGQLDADQKKVLLKLIEDAPGILSALMAAQKPDLTMLSDADNNYLRKLTGEPNPKAIAADKAQSFRERVAKEAKAPLANYKVSDPLTQLRKSQPRIAQIEVKLKIPPVTFSPGLINKTGFPTSQLLDVYGLSNCFQIAFAANEALSESIVRQKYAHLPDIQGFLQQEAIAAYRFLAEKESSHLWEQFCTPEMVTAVRARKLDELQRMRGEFRNAVKQITLGGSDPSKRPYNAPGEYSTTAALAWCILVDSALLNDKLIRDMKEVASSKGKGLAGCDKWCPYFLPEPPPECRQAFNAYVALRWPIRVFALDPYTQDQNTADQFSSRRETQLALSIAFTNGYIGANTLTKFTRRLEAEFETIALNRTQIGFSHGENVFGWRFYPRFQTPDTQSNLTVLFRDQLIGGPSRNALLRQRRLEPGPRECVALVMMPAFVPYVTVDTVSNWFALANPKHKSLDHTQALRMSKTVQALKTCGPGASDAECYREGEHRRMLRRVEQLEARLPAQTMTFPVPVMNTLGGFEMFSNGTTDLAPELYGWYGAPGVTANANTTLFLVGDHFSPLRTEVIIGNKKAVRQKLLSRQVMEVEVDGAAVLLNGTHVTAHIATPYGVTRELLIPILGVKPAEAPASEGYKLKADTATVPYCKTGEMKEGKYLLATRAVADNVMIAWDDALGTAPAKVKVTLKFTYKDCPFDIAVARDLPNDKGEYTIAPKDLEAAATLLFATLNGMGPFTDATNPLAAGLEATVVITPVDEGRAVKSVGLGKTLKLAFACSLCPPGTMPATKLPEEPKKKPKKKDGDD